MKVVFLCGGIGKRMFPITEDKFLLKFLDKTLLQIQLEAARQAGLNQFVIVCNQYNMEQIEKITSTVSDAKVKLALQKQPRGIADALKSAASFLDEDILIVNPNDIFAPSAYASLLQAAKKKLADSYMLGYRTKSYFPGGYLVVNDANELECIVEKPKPGDEPSDLVNILVHLHTDSKKLLGHIEEVKTTRDDVYECALDNLAKSGHKIKVIPYNDFWAPVKYPWHIFDVVKYVLDTSQPKVSRSASISAKATIEGKVIIGDGVKVLENAVIRGPAYIGGGSIIGNNVLVRDYSHIGADCVIGHGTEVKSSYIGDGCWVHSSYIGDSIIGRSCSFGAGTVLANFRFDERNVSMPIGDQSIDSGRDKLGAIIGDNCKTGINASVMPGIKIGPNSIVGSHVCLTKDLGPEKMILSEPHYRTQANPVKLDEAKRKELKEKLEKLAGDA
jgi:UDP-N-acetylglucosamine diphosphorylase / glucose-1-phosphate thymidylyltransferase / UDP-N-acetylgalactosamine diphosphorylase / glucosamine-1-phosphate N-acetyltransferase / galactosamine-1-phosphate N-acetyltransferase